MRLGALKGKDGWEGSTTRGALHLIAVVQQWLQAQRQGQNLQGKKHQCLLF